MRESLFARLPDLAGETVLDLFAGSGALGIEALSRGAAHAVFVDRAAPALAALRRNLAALDLEARSRVVRADAGAAVARLRREGLVAGLVLMDPPYADADVAAVMEGVAEGGILDAGGLLVLETTVRNPPGAVVGLELVDERRYGDTLLLRYTPAPGGRGIEA